MVGLQGGTYDRRINLWKDQLIDNGQMDEYLYISL